jgi:hypothetical protein
MPRPAVSVFRRGAARSRSAGSAEPGSGFGPGFVNDPFRVTEAPQPARVTLLLAGLLTAGGAWRPRRREE